MGVQLEKLAGCDKVFKEKRSGVDAGRPELKRCLEYLREGDTLLGRELINTLVGGLPESDLEP